MNQFAIIAAGLGLAGFFGIKSRITRSANSQGKAACRMFMLSIAIFLCFLPWLFLKQVFGLWMMGIAVSFVFYLRDWMKLRKIPVQSTAQSDVFILNTPTAFTTGINNPRIYILAKIQDDQRRWIFAHERYHLRHHHLFIKQVLVVCRLVFWFNPGAWLLYHLGVQRLEQRCNTAVESQLTLAERIGYRRLQRQLHASQNLWAIGFSDSPQPSGTPSETENEDSAGEKPRSDKKLIILAAVVLLGFLLTSAAAMSFILGTPKSFGHDQAALEKLLEANPRAGREVTVLAKLPEALNAYECSLLPLSNRQEIIVFLDQGGLPQAQLVYDLARDQLVKAYLPDADSALSEELCLQAAQIAGRFYADERVLKQARDKALETSGGELIAINECQAFPEFEPFQLRYGPVDERQFYIEIGPDYKLLWDRDNHQLDLKSGAFSQTAISDQRLAEIAAQTAGFYEQSVDQTQLCYISDDHTILCPNDYYRIPEAIPYVYPVTQPEILSDSLDYGVQGLDIASQTGNLEVLAAAAGRVEKVGHNEPRGTYMIINHGHRKTFYGGLSDEVWLGTRREVEPGQVIGFMKDDGTATAHVHFAMLENNHAAADSRPYLEYSMLQAKHIEVPIRVSATYAIDKTQWEKIEQVVKKSDAFEEYMPGFTPKAEHNYGSVISEIMITAQPNDFSTVTIVQNASTGEVEVSRSYLFKEEMDEVLPDVPLELILNVTIKQEAGKPSVAITANVDLSYHLYYAEGVYNPEKQILIQNDVTMSYMDASEEMRAAVTAQIEELLEKTQRIDEKALDLSEQIIQIITQGQVAAWDHSSLYDVLGR